MKVNKFYILLLFLSFIVKTIAQQEAQYTQYMYNLNIINPAYAGSKEGTLSIGLMGRSQWMNIPGSPQSATFSIHKPLNNGLGIGLSLLADKLGPVNEQFVYADVSYALPVGYYSYLAFGLKGGMSLFDAKLSDLQTYLPDDESFAEDIHQFKPNIGAGLFYYSDNHYIGISVPNILQSEYMAKEGSFYTSVSRTNHLFLTGGYVFELNDRLKFKPSTMIKMTQGAPLSVDLSANFLLQEKFEFGASYRWNDSVSALFNIKLFKDFRIGYAYDYTLTDIGKHTSGTHEVFLLFDINNNFEILSPRYF
jgi:type IX secretion system PorP/SprF family membrane protein